MKNYGRTALGVLFAAGIIMSASNAHALFGMFDDEPDMTEEKRRTPVLNSSNSLMQAPDPNLAYGSMPTTNPIDYATPAPSPVVYQAPAPMPSSTPAQPRMAMPTLPPIPEPPAFAPQPVGMPAPQYSAPMPSAAPAYQPPMPPAFTPSMPPMAGSQNVDSDGYPKLSTIPQAPVAAPPAVNPRAEALKGELQASQSMASGFQPVGVPQMPSAAPAPMAPLQPAYVAPAPLPMSAPAQSADFMQMPPPPSFQAPTPPYAPVMASNQPAPVFPSGPSVTVRSKRMGGGAVVNQTAPQQQYMPVAQRPAYNPPAYSPSYSPAPMPEVVAAPAPVVESRPITTAYAPSPVKASPVPLQQKVVGEAYTPVGSSYDSPIDAGYNSYNSPSYSAAPGRRTHAAVLPKSRYSGRRGTN